MKKETDTKKLSGFYIALCCCVIAIGVAGFIVQNNDEEPIDTPTVAETTDEPYIAYEEEIPPEPTEDVDINVAEAVIPEDDYEEVFEDYTLDNPDFVSAASITTAEDTSMFQNPLPEMTIKFGISTDTLMYNEYYKDWRSHDGIDIAADLGCSVCAAADGTVIKVSQESYGNTVTIEHKDGFKTVYAQLGEVNVVEGDSINVGAVIGTVGQSTGESMTEPHLHYELHKDGKPVNPEEY